MKTVLRLLYGAGVLGCMALIVWLMVLFPVLGMVVFWAIALFFGGVFCYAIGGLFIPTDKGDINDHYG